MTLNEFEKAVKKSVKQSSYASEIMKAMCLMQSYSSHETIGDETFEKHLAVFYDKNRMLYILVAQIGNNDQVSLIHDSYESAIKNYYLLKR